MKRLTPFLRVGRTVGLVLVAALVLAACDDGTSLDVTDADSPPELVADARYTVSYTQTEQTFSTVWPEDLVETVAKNGDAEDVEYLIDYEVTQEVVSYDAEGYMTSEYVYLEGHENTVMPESDYAEFADVMPYDAENENPIVRVRLEGEAITYYRQDGSIADQAQINPDEYRMSAAEIDSLEAVATDSTDVEGRVAAMKQRLDAEGVSYQLLSGRLATSEVALDDLGEVTKAQQVIDLAVGLPVQITYFRADGAIDMQIDRVFAWNGGVPYAAHSVTTQFGEIDGTWGVISRTETTREDVRVEFN